MKSISALVVAILLTAAIYCLGLNGPLVFDDAQNLAPITQWLHGDRSWTSVVFGNGSGLFGRPVSMASFIANVALLGPEVWSLKLGNVLLHLANGCLVYALFAMLLQCKALVREPLAINRWIPLLGAAIWMLHPLLASTVLYVIQRMAMLAAFFMLLTMLAYLKGRLALEAGRCRRAVAWFALVPICTLLATLSKENGALAPALCAVIELCVFLPAIGQRRPRISKAVVGLGLVLPALLALWLILVRHPLVFGGYANRPFTFDERLLTQPRVLWNYIGAIVLPYGPRLGLYHDDFPISHGLFDPVTTILAILAWLLVIGMAWRLRRKIPGLALGVGIFLVGQVLESSVFPLLMYFEHRNYLPAVGAIWAMLALTFFAGDRLRSHMHQPARIFSATAIALVLVLAVATAGRAMIWQSKSTLLTQALRQHPDSRWLRVALIEQAMRQQPPADGQARKHADRLMASADPSTHRLGAVLDLMVLCATGHPAPGPLVRDTFSGKPEPIEADLLVAFESLSEGLIRNPCHELPPATAAGQLASMLDRSALPRGHMSIWRLRLKSAKLYIAAGLNDDALQQARLAWANGAGDAPAGLLVTALLLRRGDVDAADKLLHSARARISSDDVEGGRLVETYQAEIDRRRKRTQTDETAH